MADTAVASSRVKELEAEVLRLTEELQACNDLLEQEWIKTAEQADIMNSLAADVSLWQVCYSSPSCCNILYKSVLGVL